MARRHFSSQALVLIVISIAINMIGGQLASMVKLPIFLDSIGTLISAVLLGPVIGMQPKLLILDEAFSRLTPQAREMLLQRLQHWALERGSLIILFERHHTPFLNHCQQAWQLQNGALQPLC